MKLIVPFDTSISPPKHHWTALWNPVVQPEAPKLENDILRRSMVSGDPCVLQNPEDGSHVGNAEDFSPWTQTKHALGAVGNWFAHRDELEEEEQLAASQGLDDLHRKLRALDAKRSRHSRI